MDLLTWATVLLLIGLVLVVLEVFVPSGGIIGTLAGLALVGSVILAFTRSMGTGVLFLCICVVAIPVCFATAVRIWPQTPLGRRMLPSHPSSTEVLPEQPQKDRLKALVGKRGRVRTVMVPSGGVEIDGRVVEAVSEGIPLDPGQLVRVVEIRGNRAVVRLIADDDQPVANSTTDLDLSRPIESIGLDPFQDPLA